LILIFFQAQELSSRTLHLIHLITAVNQPLFPLSQASEAVARLLIDRRLSRFVICNSCFWCATDISGRESITACPACASQALESIALESKEKFTFNLDSKRGVSLAFSD
jgi:hypothetical protein